MDSKISKIIGIAGTNGSGKDTVGQLLAKRHNYMFISVTDLLREELQRQGMPLDREHMRELSAQWRRSQGMGVLVEKAKAIFDAERTNYNGLAMASLRNPGEADAVHNYGGIVLWVDADPKVRYDRIQANLQLRGDQRKVDDEKTFEEFMADEAAEMHHQGDAATLSMSDVKAKSDLTLTNDGQDLEALFSRLNNLLGFSK